MLEASDWLRALSLADREALAAQMEEVFFRAGDSLFRQGDNPEGFFIIALGAIEFSVGALGEERLMYRTGAGGSLGAIALITGSPYTVNASALTAVKACRLDKEAIRAAIQLGPELVVNLEALASRWQALQRCGRRRGHYRAFSPLAG